eukprot:scaffold1050_cov51-Cylindrotheca_fusiformis.AAC.4
MPVIVATRRRGKNTTQQQQQQRAATLPLLLLLLLLVVLLPPLSQAYREESNERLFPLSANNDRSLTLELWRIVDEQASSNAEYSNGGQSFSKRTSLGAFGYFNNSSSSIDNNNNDSYYCQDQMKDCEAIAQRGECLYRSKQCPKACLLCPLDDGNDGIIFKIGEAQGIPQQQPRKQWMKQSISNNDSGRRRNDELLIIHRTAQIIMDTQEYMSNVVMQDPSYEKVRRSCLNYDKYCSAYAAMGYCNPNNNNNNKNVVGRNDDDDLFVKMMAKCAPACQTCHELELVQPCVVNYNYNVVQEGDLDIMFRSIAGGELKENKNNNKKEELPYTPRILSRPGGNGSSGENGSNTTTTTTTTVMNGAWLIALDNFLSPGECDYLIQMGILQGYERSDLENNDNDDNNYRTSDNSWCDDEQCAMDPMIRTIIQRMSDTTGIPSQYSEPLQLLRYTKGQYYKVHHDAAIEDSDELYGPRFLTFFLYLNDVEQGGATRMVD